MRSRQRSRLESPERAFRLVGASPTHGCASAPDSHRLPSQR
ncbi:hypothetical protein HMPREF0682_1380 [Propionibacterium acidifaciens F0233]|uniref:Uncharacterized protein n=1 Tax=Propionibacterium acidifaciens F0233 TaxID=553198 RepID=U2SEE7_9ACTN|nr:hypothetical protein HMPREF0682_1380 [Propionibacterium acidifaciens F0233]